ncbi:MAG: DUF6174 domain-containing protein [Pirellulales bacterium]
MRRLLRGIALVVGATAIGLWLLRTFSGGLPEIGRTDLEAAMTRWNATALKNYDLTVVLDGRQTGELRMTVRNGEPQSLTRNGTPLKQPRTFEPWTVSGMFETLTTDFDNRDEAREKFGVEPSSIHLRCEFDSQYGYPKRYLHQIYGRQQDLQWTVTEFVAR